MLTIPDSIKALYMTDGRMDIRKNFRVTFPNGELPDITNESIVQETVRFSESIMSQNTFRFGLAEAPQIEFECVGIPNMLGMAIACWHEIETTSLTAAQIAEIQAGTWDGLLVLAADSDLGYGYFRLPLGVFTVESCPRSHGAMAHRQVKATGKTIGTNKESLDAFTYWKLSAQYISKNWAIDWDFLAPSVYGNTWSVAGRYFNAAEVHGHDTVDSAGGSFSLYYPLSSSWLPFRTVRQDSAYDPVSAGSVIFGGRKLLMSDLSNTALVRIKRTGVTEAKLDAICKNVVDSIFATVEEENPTFDWTKVSKSVGPSQYEAIGDRADVYDYIYNAIRAGALESSSVFINGDNSSSRAPGEVFSLPAFGDIDMILNMASASTYSSNAIYMTDQAASWKLQYPNRSSGTSIKSFSDQTIDGADIKFYELELKNEYRVDFPVLKLPTTLEVKRNGVKYYGYFNSFSFKQLMVGFFETNGIFGRVKRDGSVDLYAIDKTTAETLTQSDVQELWWDESTVQPIGIVNVKFKTDGSDEEQSAAITIGDGSSSYNMTDCYLLTKWSTTLSSIETLLSGNFAEHIKALTWTTVDATIRGLPYLEAGDWIICETGDESLPTVGFPILDHEIGGIQSLTDNITATAGDITEVLVEEDDA